MRRRWSGLPHPADGALHFDDAGFRRAPPDGFAAAWNEVVRISGWRSDLWSPDEVRIQVDLAGGDVVVFGEESPGFPALMVAFEQRFPPVAGWFERIALPADDGHRTLTLYERGG
ncbi:hypothetical protein P873_12415 [Arenimonas composti TR7-09 = DSM 18010]|uniref:Uncharacterized protein n=1 Tax=Arenimonas composti TR7-09 = DSM 18010 TaxID=1121013 RepID=A0A091BXL5_9GAMM|nr:hypothetical protein P873_12415 [Arenimonas composti TR7-09 = DSM 18010]